MAHRNARLTEFGRLLLVQRITELGWRPAQAAESLGVSRATAYKWLGRYRVQGRAGLADRSSRPAPLPHALPAAQVRRVLAAWRRHRQGPHRLAWQLHPPRWTIYGVLRRHGLESPRPPRPEQRRGRAMSVSTRASWSLGRQEARGASPRVAATSPRADGGHPPRPGGSAMTTSTRPSMTAPGSPSASSSSRRLVRPRPLLVEAVSASPTTAWSSSGC